MRIYQAIEEGQKVAKIAVKSTTTKLFRLWYDFI